MDGIKTNNLTSTVSRQNSTAVNTGIWLYKSVTKLKLDDVSPTIANYSANPLTEEPFTYGARSYVRPVEINNEIFVEKLCMGRKYDLSKEYEIAQRLSKHDHMQGWFMPTLDRAEKFEKRIGQKDRFIGWTILMKPASVGTLANIISEHSCQKLSEQGVANPDYKYSEYDKPQFSIGEDAARFYLANAAIILAKLHKSGVVWSDIKPENFLIDENGYLIAADFGECEIIENLKQEQTDWRILGRRVGNYAFRLAEKSPIASVIRLLEAGQITSLADLKKQDAFTAFDWEALEAKQIQAPYKEIREKLAEKKYQSAILKKQQ